MPTELHANRRAITADSRPVAAALALLVLALAGIAMRTRDPVPASPERAVLDAVLGGLDVGVDPSRVAVAPSTATMSPDWFPEIGAVGSGPEAALWHRLATLSTTARDGRALALPARAWTLSPMLATAFESHDASWLATLARLRLRLGGNAGVVRLSPVAFARDGASALVYYEYRCGALCGQGTVAWLVRLPDGSWRVRERQRLWIM